MFKKDKTKVVYQKSKAIRVDGVQYLAGNLIKFVHFELIYWNCPIDHFRLGK